MNRPRIFLCGYYCFPKGSAAANYIQNLAQVFLILGYNIVLITNINKQEKIEEYPFLVHNKGRIIVHDINLPKGKFSHYIAFNILLSKYFREALSQYKISAEDILVAYSVFPQINRVLLDVAKNAQAKTIACVVEWFTEHEFTYGFMDWRYWRYIVNFKYIFPKFHGVLSISTMLNEHFNGTGVKSIVVPIMSDPYEFDYQPNRSKQKIKFVYPANGLIKDSVDVVLKSFLGIDHKYYQFIEVHLSGVSKEKIITYLGEKQYKTLKPILHMHSWMEYRELVDLYLHMDFLIISRPKNRMTKANFPSKVPEAMNYGVIPVVTRVGDYTSLYLNEANSVVFDLNRVSDCKAAIERCLTLSMQQRQVMALQVRETSINKFYYKNWCSLIADFLKCI